MELGGKASAIVLADADLELAALHCAKGAFMNVSHTLQNLHCLIRCELTTGFQAGQICMSTERILVHCSVASKFQDILCGTVNQLFGTNDKTPVVVTGSSAKRNRGLVADAVSKGAKPMQIFDGGDHQDVETRMQPVVLTNVDHTMQLYGNESFGPSVSLYTFEDESEALTIANDTEYGLSASVFTEDLRAGLRIADGLESGAVHINSMTVHDEYPLPHGGVKKSGFGRFNGYAGLDEFLYHKTVTWME